MQPFDYHRPRSLDEARLLHASVPGSIYVAGGTDVLVRMKQHKIRPSALISLRNIPGLSGITIGLDGARIGATTLIADIAAHPDLASGYPALVAAAGALGGPQIRNAATLGGNLSNASPCADTAPPLLVVDADVELTGDGGVRTMPLHQFFLGPKQTALRPDELLTAVLLPPAKRPVRQIFMKKKRVAMDLAIASVAARIELDGRRCLDVRIAAGSVAPMPVRLRSVEALLVGHEIDDALLERVQATAHYVCRPISDVRGPAEYRRALVSVFVKRAVKALVDGRQP